MITGHQYPPKPSSDGIFKKYWRSPRCGGETSQTVLSPSLSSHMLKHPPLEGRSRFTTLQELGMNLTTQEAPEAHKIHKSSPPTHFHPRVIQAITTAREEAPAGSATYKLCRELKKCSFHDSSPTLGCGSQWYGCLSHQCCCK